MAIKEFGWILIATFALVIGAYVCHLYLSSET